MSDKQALVKGTPGHAGDAPRAPGRWPGFLAHRWPTLLGLALGALAALPPEDASASVSPRIAAVLVLMPLVYVGAAALERPRAAWVVFLAAVAVLIVVPPVPGIAVFLVAAALFLALGLARGQLRRPGGLTLQAAGMLAFGAMAVAALSVAPERGVYLVAVGILAHGAWDAVHYLRDRVVARSYAEFCAILDCVLGVALLVLA